jgi:glyoxylase I family protein
MRTRAGIILRCGTERPILDAMHPLAVHHVSVNVSDVAKSVLFYTEVLGGTLRDDRPDFPFGGAWINLGTAQVHLIEAATPPNLGQHFAILVDDLDSVVAELSAKNVSVELPVIVGHDRQTFLSDPDDNTIELHQIGTHSS